MKVQMTDPTGILTTKLLAILVMMTLVLMMMKIGSNFQETTSLNNITEFSANENAEVGSEINEIQIFITATQIPGIPNIVPIPVQGNSQKTQ